MPRGTPVRHRRIERPNVTPPASGEGGTLLLAVAAVKRVDARPLSA